MPKFKTKYRIVRDEFEGYEVQYKPWWSPWYIECNRVGGVNTHKSLETAKKFLEDYKNNSIGKVVYVEG